MRDRDVRNAIQAALLETQAFDNVYLWGLPEDFGSGASNAAVAVIEPDSGRQADRWDAPTAGDLIVTSVVKITFMQRASDPQVDDEACELLFNKAADALNGQSLAGFTMPEFTKFLSWKWQRRIHPERRIESLFSYQYIVSGWNALDTTS